MTKLILITALILGQKSWFDADPAPPVAAEPDVPFAVSEPAVDAPAPPEAEEPVKLPKEVTLSPLAKQRWQPEPSQHAAELVTMRPNLPANLLKNEERYELIGLAPKWCKECWRAKERLVRNHFLTIRWTDQEPADCPMFPAIYDAETDTYHTGESLASWTALHSSLNRARGDAGLKDLNEPEPMRAVGSIDRDAIIKVMQLIGRSGTMNREDDERSFPFGSFDVRLPPAMNVKWSTNATGTRFVFTGRTAPRISYGPTSARLSAVVATPERVVLELDWVPDVVFEVR